MEKSINKYKEYLKSKCYGCGLCRFFCPNKSIEMTKDIKGFFFPNVKKTCIECGFCVTKCPVISAPKRQNMEQQFFYGSLKKNVPSICASGGAFFSLSEYVLKKEGFVIGAILEDNFSVQHHMTTTQKERDRMCGSKYIQSSLEMIYSQILDVIKTKKIILFSGTPCQCSAIVNLFDGKVPSNLILVDLLCHGIAGDKTFKDYICDISKQVGAKVCQYNFRDRKFGMKGSNVSIYFDNGDKIENKWIGNTFDKLYSRGYLMRESCYNCSYSSSRRIGDISIGDCWGIEKINPLWDISRGASLVIINSQKGLTLLDKISYLFEYHSVNKQSCLQDSLRYSITKPLDFDFFWKHYYKKGYQKTTHLFLGNSLKAKIYKVYIILRKLIKKYQMLCKKTSYYWNRTSKNMSWYIAYRRKKSDSILSDINSPFNIMTCPTGTWTADPFLFEYHDENYIFYELFINQKNKGVIAYSKIIDGQIGKINIVLEEQFHLSFPCVFRINEEIFMIPETGSQKSIILYKCINFPDKWIRIKTLAQGLDTSDTIIYTANDKIYVVASLLDGNPCRAFNTIYTFDVSKLTLSIGYYQNKISERGQRNGGFIFKDKGQLYRPSQNCEGKNYGKSLIIQQIDSISPYKICETEYKEIKVEDLSINSEFCFSGIHTYNQSSQYEVIDLRMTQDVSFLKRTESFFYIVYKYLKKKLSNEK